MTPNTYSTLAPKETLGSIHDANRSVICARYESATRTLCGRESFDGFDAHGPQPTCPACVEVATVFDGIDGSAPDHWGWRREAA